MRDQGLTRPRVLIVVPFRDAALRIVNNLIGLLLAADSQNVGRRKRFSDEYGEDEAPVPNKYPMPGKVMPDRVGYSVVATLGFLWESNWGTFSE